VEVERERVADETLLAASVDDPEAFAVSTGVT
jgi:hypothetical protein